MGVSLTGRREVSVQIRYEMLLSLSLALGLRLASRASASHLPLIFTCALPLSLCARRCSLSVPCAGGCVRPGAALPAARFTAQTAHVRQGPHWPNPWTGQSGVTQTFPVYFLVGVKAEDVRSFD